MRWLDALIDRFHDSAPSGRFSPFSVWGSLVNVVVSGFLVVGFVWATVVGPVDVLLVLPAVGAAGLFAVFLRTHVRVRRGDFLP